MGIVSAVWLLSTYLRPVSVHWQTASMFFDHGMISYGLCVAGDHHLTLFVMFFWVIVGNGYRFGPHYVIPSMVISLISFWIAAFLSDFWMTHPHYVVELTAVHIMVSLFIYKVISSLSDVKERAVELEQRVERSEKRDVLTGLFNREKITEWLSAADEQGRHVGVMFVDLDNFKGINDQFGHQVGDDVLINTAKRLQNSVRTNDLVCRYAGDEFVILVDDNRDVIQQVASRVVASLNTPIRIDGRLDVKITGSIGIAILGIDGITVKDVIVNADVAMYKAKQQGRNAAVWYGDQQ